MSRFSGILAAGLLCTACADIRAEEKPTLAAALDNEFLVKAHAANNAQIEYGKLAEKRSASQRVKDFAQQMVKDHGAAQESLGRLYKDRKFASVAGLDKEFRDERDRLAKLENSEFDRAYMKRVVEDHEKVVALYDVQVRDGKDTAIAAWAKESAPSLKKHQQLAKEVAAELGKQ